MLRLASLPALSLEAAPALDDQHRLLAPGTVALIPAYNEQRFIGSMILAVHPYVDEVVVVDDGSIDRTAEIARRAGAIVIQHQHNQGKAAAINTGFTYLRQIGPSAVVMLDGDGQHCADDIAAVLAPVVQGEADVVVGSRFLDIHSEIPAYRRIGQHSLTLVSNLASGVCLSDSQSGFRAFSRHALECLVFSQGGFSIESEMQFLAHEHDLRVAEVPISVVYAEPPKRNPFRHGMQVLSGIVALLGQTRPLFYFGLIGLLFLALATLLGLHIVDIFVQTAQLAVGYALITVILYGLGMALFLTGVILQSTRGMLHELRQGLLAHITARHS